MSYQEDVARYQQQALQRQQQDYERQVQALREQRAREDHEVELNQLRYGQQQALIRRQEIEQEAARTNDPTDRELLMTEWHSADQEFLACGRELQKLTPPQINPTVQRFAREDQAFYQREGQNGLAAMDRAHAYLVSRGWPSGTARTLQGARDLVGMYGQDSRISGLPPVRYDENERALDWKEAAAASGLSEQSYLHAYNTLKKQGRVG